MSTENWRTQVNASDYLGAQKKRVEIEQRRPTIRKAADLVGPGIGAEAVRITDYNDLLATFNGYYASDAGAANAPNVSEAFIGQVVSDSVLGGKQTFTGLTSGNEYTRTFNRSPTDPESLGWGPWTGQRIPPTVAGLGTVVTEVTTDSSTLLVPPPLHGVGDWQSVYSAIEPGIRITRQGIYSGSIQVGCNGSGPVQVTIQRPDGFDTVPVFQSAQLLLPTVHYPFTAIAQDGLQGISVQVFHSFGIKAQFFWRFQCTRIGDAI